jgi:acyl-CoA dehydrogenase
MPSSSLSRGLAFPMSEATAALHGEVWTFAHDRLVPLSAGFDCGDEKDPEIARLVREAGYLGHYVPAELGGHGLSVTNISVVREALAYGAVAVDEFFASQGIAVQPITLFGSEDQKAHYLGGLLSGSRSFALCVTEPVAGSDVAGIRTAAVAVDGGFEINGTKRFVHMADTVDTMVLFAKTGPGHARGGLTAFVLDRPEQGLVVTPFPLLFEGPEFEVEFQGCRIPGTAVLGSVGGGMGVAMSNFDRIRPSVGAAAVGMAQRALDATVDYVQSREAFTQRLADFQGVRMQLSDIAVELAAARLCVYAAARFADEAHDDADVRAPAAAAKLYATEVAQRVIDRCVQLHGGVGLVRGSVTERLYRAIRSTRIYEGATDIMRIVVARDLLGPRARR